MRTIPKNQWSFPFQKITGALKMNNFWNFEEKNFILLQEQLPKENSKLFFFIFLGPQNGQICFWPCQMKNNVLLVSRTSVLAFK